MNESSQLLPFSVRYFKAIVLHILFENISGFPICPEIPKLFRDSRNLGFSKFWFGIGLEIGIPKNFGLGIGTWFSVRYPIPNQP
ncbi:hypothetical protein DVH24_009385 [Malus domestica]|uniref:Uncharacterized protein n=1 Tax=Malus domestica TaxID=3750 RepID=A0A498ITQ6_MALDO|nr:hypothetical protein DVH24_009385 [Malus domestica]